MSQNFLSLYHLGRVSKLEIQIHPSAAALFASCVISVIGDGRGTLFWQDRWLLGQRLVDLAPRTAAFVPKRIAKTRTVAEALENSRWINDFRGVPGRSSQTS